MTYCSLLVSLLILITVPVAHGQVVVQHLGANDPESEGFTLRYPGGAEVGPVFGDMGRDAWSIRPRSETEYGFYEYALTDHQRQEAAMHGWELSVTLRLLNIPDDGGNSVLFSTGTHGFFMEFSVDPEGIIFISDSLSGGTYRFDDGDIGYHRYTLIYEPLAESAALWIDGVDRKFDFRSRRGSDAFVRFGGGQTITHTHWHEVSLTIIPEPVAVALLSGVLALACVIVVRWRKWRQAGRRGL